MTWVPVADRSTIRVRNESLVPAVPAHAPMRSALLARCPAPLYLQMGSAGKDPETKLQLPDA